MATCATHGHLFGADDRCLHCGDPAPQIPEFLRGAREPDWRDAEIVRLQAFKNYVHARLDAAGIPTHPDGEHSKAGCRIGDRLDIALTSLDEAAIHAVAWRALGYVLGKFPELLDVILNEWRALVAMEERL